MTPVVSRPIGRTSFSEKRMPMPWRVPMKIWSSPPVMRTESSSSPSSMLIAMMPPERTFE